MPQTVTLDAMIKRSDFSLIAAENDQVESIRTLSIENLGPKGLVSPLLRKPDFQRETNQWTPLQLVGFLESFLDNQLIPSIILWKSNSFVFVIDGGHRLSALMAWMNDDYGIGPVSARFYSGEITEAQKRIAKRTKKLVDERVGSYSLLRDALDNPDGHEEASVRRAKNMAIRQLDLQWVNGDAEKAESSFFKINTQGTPLDKTEELLLRNRKRSVAIAARSIVRAGTGHKYWSDFSESNVHRIEELASEIHVALFNPELNTPIRTLDLPIGGAKSPIAALELLIQMMGICSSKENNEPILVGEFPEDHDGSETIKVLQDFKKVVGRMCGNAPGSLGLHPAIYFYSHNGRHLPNLVMGVLRFFSRKIRNNDQEFFKKFSTVRSKIEDYLISNKSLITQGLQLSRSRERNRVTEDFFEFLYNCYTEKREVTDNKMLLVLAPHAESKIVALTESSQSIQFSDDTKSSIFIRKALENCLRCPICDSYVDASKSATYDHVTPIREGGRGNESNGDILHPFCNSGIKN